MTEEQIYFSVGNRRLRKYDIKQVEGEDILVETEDWKNFKKERTAMLSLERNGIQLGEFSKLDQYKGEDRPKNIDKLKKFIEEFNPRYIHTHLYFYSPSNSTQKTTISKIVAKELAIKGFLVMFINMDELVKKLTQETFDESNDDILRKVREADFLVIDDAFDPSKMTLYRSKYQLSFIDSFLRFRLETKRKSTCFTSNTDPSEIGKVFDRHIEALIKRTTVPMMFSDCIDGFDLSEIWK